MFTCNSYTAMQLQESSQLIEKTKIIDQYNKLFLVAKYLYNYPDLYHSPKESVRQENEVIQNFFSTKSHLSLTVTDLQKRFAAFHRSESKLASDYYLITVLSMPQLPHDIKARIADFFSQIFCKDFFLADRTRFIQGFSSQAVMCFQIHGKFVNFDEIRKEKKALCIEKLSSKINSDTLSSLIVNYRLNHRDFLEIFYAKSPNLNQMEKDFKKDSENIDLFNFMNNEIDAFINIWKKGYDICFCDNYFDGIGSFRGSDDGQNSYPHSNKSSYISVAKKRLLTFEEEFLLNKIISGDDYKMTDADVAVWSEIKKKIKPNESHYSADNIYNSKIDIEELPVSVPQKIFKYTLSYTPMLIAGFLPDYISLVCNHYRWLYHVTTASALYIFGDYIFPRLEYAYSPQVQSLKHFFEEKWIRKNIQKGTVLSGYNLSNAFLTYISYALLFSNSLLYKTVGSVCMTLKLFYFYMMKDSLGYKRAIDRKALSKYPKDNEAKRELSHPGFYRLKQLKTI